jgi:hypothetical protein
VLVVNEAVREAYTNGIDALGLASVVTEGFQAVEGA